MLGADFWRGPPASNSLKQFTGFLLVPVLWLALVWLVEATIVIETEVVRGSLQIGLLMISGLLAWIIVRNSSTRAAAGVLALAYLGPVGVLSYLMIFSLWSHEPTLLQEQQKLEAIEQARKEREQIAEDTLKIAASEGNPAAKQQLRLLEVDLKKAKERVEARNDLLALPIFPWPPPQTSASYVLPASLLQDYESVGEIVNAILSALERNGYVERSFFRTEADGVALVTRLERIKDDGSAFAAPERWPSLTPTPYDFGPYALIRFLSGLFTVDPGHYRIIAFILQDASFTQSPRRITVQEAQAWLSSGANVLPSVVANRPLGDAHCTVLIYEFASDGTQVRVVDSRLTGKDHLAKAGVLSLLEKSN
jgi:hypothetical protein